MNETLAAVAITGAVTLLATWIGPLISERAVNRRDRETHRRAEALDLRPLGLNAIQSSKDAINLTHTALRAGILGASAVSAFDRRSERGRDEYLDAHRRAGRALTELELSTGDADVNEVADNLMYVLQTATSAVWRLHLQSRNGGTVDARDVHLIELAETAAFDGIQALKLVLQPITTADDSLERLTSQRTAALAALRFSYAEVLHAADANSGDFSGTPDV